MTVALAMIARNNADTIAGPLQDALDSGVDKLVVVDTGSTDDTIRVAQSFGAEIHHYVWHDDFSAARNYSITCCDTTWVLFLDSIDRVSNPVALRDHFKALPDTRADAILLDVHYGIGAQAALTTHIKLIRKESGLRFRYPIHENIDCGTRDVYHWRDVHVNHPRGFMVDNRERNLLILGNAYFDNTFNARDQDYKQHIRFNYGRELLGEGRNDSAVMVFTEFIENGGQFDYWAQFYRALATVDPTTRMSRLRATVYLDEKKAEAWVEIGNLLIKQERYRQALTPLNRAVNCRHFADLSIIQYPPDYTWRPWALLSVAWQQLGNEEQASKCWAAAQANGVPVEDKVPA